MQDVVIVIPLYQSDLRWYEQLSLERCFEVLGHYPIVFLVPEGKKLDLGEAYRTVPRVSFPQQYFQDVWSYNSLMLSPAFYQRFAAYRKMLIYQLDAFVFSDRLADFVAMDYDWIGAPWFLDICWYRGGAGRAYARCGNGGFCLRDIQACLRVLRQYPVTQQLAEDKYFAIHMRVDKAFRLAPLSVARAFSSEYDAERVWQKNHYQLPFGCHAWQKYSGDFYVWAFGQVGYDMRKVRTAMYDIDLIHVDEMLHDWHDRHARGRGKQAVPSLAACTASLRQAIGRQDIDAAAKIIWRAEPLLRPDPGQVKPEEVYMAEHFDALLYRGIRLIEQEGRYGPGIRYLQVWRRLAYKYYQKRWPELYTYIARAYEGLHMPQMAQHYRELCTTEGES